MALVVEKYGGTTWDQIKDRFLLAAGTTYAAGNTGGEATHKLTVAEMPSHTHWVGSHTYGASAQGSYDSMWTRYNGGFNTGSAGSDSPHNNMPPYLVVYIWKRIA